MRLAVDPLKEMVFDALQKVLFDTWVLIPQLEADADHMPCSTGPTPLGARQAALTGRTKPYMEEVALNEQVSISLL